MLTVTTAATDRSLLTLAELRSAVNASDGSKDAALLQLETRVSSAITAACKVAADGAIPPTLRQESVTETFRLKNARLSIVLARKPVISLAVTEDDVPLGATSYEMEAAAGMLRRLYGERHGCWRCGKIVVAYVAGWETVPEDLKLAAVKFIQAEWKQGSRDPLLKRVHVEGVSEREYWVDPTKDSVVPAEVMDILQRGGYINTWI